MAVSAECPQDGLCGGLYRGLILHRLQETPLGVEVLQRLRLLMIDLEPRFHGLGGIIFPLDQLAAALVAHALLLGGHSASAWAMVRGTPSRI